MRILLAGSCFSIFFPVREKCETLVFRLTIRVVI